MPAVAGLGLRFAHLGEVIATDAAIPFVEVHGENHLSGPAGVALEVIRRDRAVSLHCVGLSLGSAQGLDDAHLQRLAELARRVEPALVSEHLAWNAVDHAHLADLLPLPLNRESLDVVCRNVERMQEAFGRTILVENPATYVQFPQSDIPEGAFMDELCRRTGCGMLCDVANIVVAAHNHGWDARAHLASFPAWAIGEYHLAGHERADGLLIDTHDRDISIATWELFDEALASIGPRPALAERDRAIPGFAAMLTEMALVQAHLDRAEQRRAA
ncbi:MAG: DUF692 domain-containing protein [Rhodospirillales bacterium]|nr:DUF692 domain-containing protein [Rhodospirillales bacterium]